MSDVLVRRQGRAGRITLDRPAALNALTHAMVGPIHAAFDAFAADEAIELVVLDAAGGRAFCAGGDIVALYRTGRSDPAAGRAFWRDEYRLNAAIARFPKPVVALLDGIVMGGGVGLGCHCPCRVVTERSVIAMPEANIGFAPDVGGTRLLALAPGRVGEYLASTAARMTGADAIFAGFADHFVAAEELPALADALAERGLAALPDFAGPPPASTLAQHAAEIDALFAEPDVPTLVDRLEHPFSPQAGRRWSEGPDEGKPTGQTPSSGASQPSLRGLRKPGSDRHLLPQAGEGELGYPDASGFARDTAAAIRRNAPFSVSAAILAVRMARTDPGIEACLAREYRYSFRVLERDDFYEGVRAQVVDKDRQPRWRPASFAEVDPAAVEAAYAPLGADEWTL